MSETSKKLLYCVWKESRWIDSGKTELRECLGSLTPDSLKKDHERGTDSNSKKTITYATSPVIRKTHHLWISYRSLEWMWIGSSLWVSIHFFYLISSQTVRLFLSLLYKLSRLLTSYSRIYVRLPTFCFKALRRFAYFRRPSFAALSVLDSEEFT